MKSGFQSALFSFLALTLIAPRSHSEENKKEEPRFPSVGERRLEIVAEKVESLGCVLDKNAVLNAKNGETIVFRHKEDRRGDVTIVFNHLVLPKGNWVLYGAKNDLDGEACESVPEKTPDRMEAVSAVLTGLAINATQRSFDGAETYRMVYVDLRRLWGWNIGIAHSMDMRSALHGFGYYVPSGSKLDRKKYDGNQLPIVNVLHRDDAGKLMAGGLYWLQNAAGK